MFAWLLLLAIPTQSLGRCFCHTRKSLRMSRTNCTAQSIAEKTHSVGSMRRSQVLHTTHSVLEICKNGQSTSYVSRTYNQLQDVLMYFSTKFKIRVIRVQLYPIHFISMSFERLVGLPTHPLHRQSSAYLQSQLSITIFTSHQMPSITW